MLRLIHPNGAYTDYVKDSSGWVFAVFSGAIIGTSDPMSVEELFDDISGGVAGGARVEVVADNA